MLFSALPSKKDRRSLTSKLTTSVLKKNTPAIQILTQAVAISISILSSRNADTGQRQSDRLRRQDAVPDQIVCDWWKFL